MGGLPIFVVLISSQPIPSLIAPLASNHSWNFANNLLIDETKRVNTGWYFTNKTGFRQLTQRFYFVRKMMVWDT